MSPENFELGDRAGREGRLRILFFMLAINFDRVFECFLRELLERGHEVRVLLDRQKTGLPAGETALFDALRAEFPNFSYALLGRRRTPWLRAATAVRHAIDYLRYLEPEFRDAHALRERARLRASRLVRAPLRLPLLRAPSGRWAVGRLLRRVEAALPIPAKHRKLVAGHSPDVVLVSPLVGLGSWQGEHLRVAAQLGIPSVLVVASWDNLTNKGIIRDVPTWTIVWNAAQVDEATRLHGLAPERVVATGAHTFDHWFGWSPSTTRAEFAGRLGFDPARPILLYVGSSRFIAEDEAEFVSEWVRRLRASGDRRLAEAGVIVRPHPQNAGQWREFDVSELGSTVVWPRAGAAPTDAERKADYWDSLHHSSAVIGINTSALIEAAIARRPVLTLADERFRQTQEGTLHFAHLAGAEGDGGVLTVARSWGEHLSHLVAALDRPDVFARRIEGFLESFVRPDGLDRAAAPQAADIVERAAATAVERVPAPAAASVALRALTPIVVAAAVAHDLLRFPARCSRWLLARRAEAQVGRRPSSAGPRRDVVTPDAATLPPARRASREPLR